MQSVEKLFKQNGTPVYVRFGLALQLVLLNIKDWEQELKDLWATLVKANTSEVYEDYIDHGVTCHCCAKINVESYTHPTAAESRRKRRPGRPRTRREGSQGNG